MMTSKMNTALAAVALCATTACGAGFDLSASTPPPPTYSAQVSAGASAQGGAVSQSAPGGVQYGAAPQAQNGAAPGAPAGQGAMAGLTARQEDFARRQNEYFYRIIPIVENHCGWAPQSEISWTSFAGEVDRHLDTRDMTMGFHGRCKAPLEEMHIQCRDNPSFSQRAQARFNSYVCIYGGPNNRGARIENGTLIYQVDWQSTNDNDFMEDFFGRNL